MPTDWEAISPPTFFHMDIYDSCTNTKQKSLFKIKFPKTSEIDDAEPEPNVLFLGSIAKRKITMVTLPPPPNQQAPHKKKKKN